MDAQQAWMHDEFQHVGVDFDDPQEVATYDARKYRYIPAHESVLLSYVVEPHTSV